MLGRATAPFFMSDFWIYTMLFGAGGLLCWIVGFTMGVAVGAWAERHREGRG